MRPRRTLWPTARTAATTLTAVLVVMMVLAVPVVSGRILSCGAALIRGHGLRPRQLHPGAVLQAIGAIGDNFLSGIQTAQNCDLVAVRWPQRHRAHADGAVGIDRVHIVACRAALDRGDGHRRLIVQRADQKADIDELLWE